MSSSGTRISVIATCLMAGFVLVLLHLWFLMVQDNEAWVRRSHENRWSFRAVPSKRGALLDRHGRVLAHDTPTMQLSLHYLRFRLRHPVGAAVHGATTWASLQAGRAGTTYCYQEGALGPEAALREFLTIPARVFLPGVLQKDVAQGLAFGATTVLSACSGLSRKRVFAALRLAAQDGGGRAIGDVLPVARAELEDAFARNLESLRRLDQDVLGERRARNLRLGLPEDEATGLVDSLEFMRRASLAKARVRWVDTGNTPQEGSLLETVRRSFADHVAFELAAALRIGAEQHPGLEVSPSIERVRGEPDGTSLRVLLGGVSDLDRAQPDDQWFERHLAQELPDDWLSDLVPSGAVASAEDRERLQDDAKLHYEREMMRRERRGTSGLEAAFDDALMGRLGLRLVEHDSKQREHLLWSHLRVESGADITLTLDLALQRAAEQVVGTAFSAMRALHTEAKDQRLVEAALAVIDARTGDVLAYAGAPIVSASARDVPGVVWQGNGAIGSVVKPFVLVEQLQSELVGRPHRPIADLNVCSGVLKYGGTLLHCSHTHGDAGRDPVTALAESCNSFFYQCGIGLLDDGMARALRRFGLMEPAGPDDPFVACWQPSVRGIAAARPRVDLDTVLPQRAVGYGVEASPLSVARAYAALATSCLPTVGLLLGEARPRVALGEVEVELEVVRKGLRACMQTGTGKKLLLLDDFQVLGKTGTAEVGLQDQNNAWFAGYLPWAGRDGVQLCFCACVYWVADRVHGGDAAGQVVVDLLAALQGDAELNARYLQPEGGR